MRADRDQVTALVNAHVAAVVPGMSVSVHQVMSQLEREPGEFIVDRWVRERLTLVAEQRGRVVAAAHLLRYADGSHIGETYRNAGEIRWLLWWPAASYWPDTPEAAALLGSACLAQLRRWEVSYWYADGTLPALGVYGVPEQWPHIRETYQDLGFTEYSQVEAVYIARVADLARPAEPVEGLAPSRAVGEAGTRISGVVEGDVLGYVEVDTNLDDAARMPRTGGWADVGNLHVAEAHRRQGIGTWLLGQAAAWLELGDVTRLLSYVDVADDQGATFLKRSGFRALTRTVRGLTVPGS